MKSAASHLSNLAGSGMDLSKSRCVELSEQLQCARQAYQAQLLQGCSPADFPYLQQLIAAVEVAQSVLEAK